MIKKNRLSFSAISVDNKKAEKTDRTEHRHTPRHNTNSAPHGEHRGHAHKRTGAKTSTYQYTKKSYGRGSSARPFTEKSARAGASGAKILPPEAGVVRIIPLGGVEEIGKNMTAIEIGDDIIVIDAGMHFSNEETPGVDYVIPNTTYLEERKDKIRALFVTHGHLDHIGGVPLVLSRIGNPPVYSRNLSILMMRKRQAEFPQLPAMKENIVEKDSTIM